MKKSILLAAVGGLLAATSVQAGEYLPYVGFDYVNRTLNVSDVYPDNYDIGNINAGVKFVDFGSLELFAERSMREKKKFLGNTVRGRLYNYGADFLLNGYNFSEGAILGSVGYGRVSTKLKLNGHKAKDTGNTLRFGLGGEFNPTPEWGFRAMYRYSLSDSNAFANSKEFSIGARYYFY